MLGLLHLLKLAAPFGPVRGAEQLGGLVLGLVDGAGQVPATDAELDRDQAVALFAVDRRGALADEVPVRIGPAPVVERRHQVAEAAAGGGGDVVDVGVVYAPPHR